MRSFCAASLAPDALSTCQGELLEDCCPARARASKIANTACKRVSRHAREILRSYRLPGATIMGSEWLPA